MATKRRKRGASLCLSAALLTLLTPLLFLLHADACGTHFPNSGLASLAARAEANPAPASRAGYGHPHRGNAHDPNACVFCQALIQYVSGVTLGFAQEAPAPAPASPHDSGGAAILPRGERFSLFFPRAPPAPADSVRS